LNLFGSKHDRVLVVRPDRIGDVVLSTPVYHTLKDSFQNSFVAALVSPYTSALLEGNPYIDSVITYDPAKENFWEKVKEIRKFKFDTALLLLPTKSLAYRLFLAGIPYRVGVGHILYEVITFMHGVSRKKYIPLRHESDYMLDLARKIGAKKTWTKPEVFLSENEKDTARQFLEQKGFDVDRPVAGIHPGSGHSSPNWRPEAYSELSNMLVKNDVQVLVTGAGHEKDLERFFSESSGRNLKTTFGELSLRELVAVISQMSLFVSSSTGPMHIASAVGTPTVSMFCPLTACSPKLWGPIGNVSKVILPPDNFCQAKCPGDPHVCTYGDGSNGITAREVFDAVMQMIGNSRMVRSNFSHTHEGIR
jgi:ADP-heptose:LPS heptosyltransferase